MTLIVPESYCRDLETYLCQKNEGHLVRIVGPAFDVVSRWETDGIPFKVACAGIDRYFERYYRQGTRRRPVRIDFCDADVRDVFEEWRRATGLAGRERASSPEVASKSADSAASRRGPSLPEHLERALLRLTNARATGAVGEAFDPILDAVAKALDTARAAGGGLRGEARTVLVSTLESHDRALGQLALEKMEPAALAVIRQEAEEELAAFKAQLPNERYLLAVSRATDRLVRRRLGLPTLTFS